MIEDYQPSAKLVELLLAVTEGQLDQSQRDRLNDLLSSDPAACDYYVRYISLHGMLQARHGRAPVLELPLGGPEPATARRSSRPVIWIAMTAAAVVLAAVALGSYLLRDGEPPVAGGGGPGGKHKKPAPIATVLDAENVRWENDSSPGAGDRLPVGRRRLQTGVARLELQSGVIVALQGPVEFELFETNRLRIHRGVLRAYVPPAARGFTVNAPGVDVVDLGTELGVSVNAADDVEVHVFAGRVRINVQAELSAGEAMRIDHKRKRKKIKLAKKSFPPIER